MSQIALALAAAVIAFLTVGAPVSSGSHAAPPVVSPQDIIPPTGL